MRRWFAVLYKHARMGYALDCYPDERASAIRQEGGAIIGDYATEDDAQEAVRAALRRLRPRRGVTAVTDCYRV
jgi:hypothetical protein